MGDGGGGGGLVDWIISQWGWLKNLLTEFTPNECLSKNAGTKHEETSQTSFCLWFKDYGGKRIIQPVIKITNL